MVHTSTHRWWHPSKSKYAQELFLAQDIRDGTSGAWTLLVPALNVDYILMSTLLRRIAHIFGHVVRSFLEYIKSYTWFGVKDLQQGI
jgi:hypothetical protein